MSEFGALDVETRPDGSGRPSPVRFGWGEATHQVAEVQDRWPGEGHEYFRVRCDNEAIYILRHDLAADRWELVYFEEGGELAGGP